MAFMNWGVRVTSLLLDKILIYVQTLFVKGDENLMNDPVTYLRLISELEGSSQLLNLLNEQEDKELIDLLKRKYYKLYFITKKDAKET